MSDLKVVQFGADWCVPCKRMKPIATSVAQKEGIPYFYQDVEGEEGMELSQELGIQSLPTFIIFDGETPLNNATGMMSPAKFTEFLQIAKTDSLVDEQGDESFPASDPPGNY